MTRPDQIGIGFLDRPGLGEQLELVRRADELGYNSAWVAETRLTRDAVSVLGAVERTFSWLNRYRRLLIQWEKKSENYLSFLHLACAIIT
jgi:Transposase DDE domain